MVATNMIQRAHLAQRGKLVSVCKTTTQITHSSNALNVLFSSMHPIVGATGAAIPGARKSTMIASTIGENDIFRIPINRKGSNVVFYIMADSAIPAVATYPQLAIRLPNPATTIQDASPAWMTKTGVGTSTESAGWVLIKATAATLATTTGEGEGFLAGPFDTAKYALNFGVTATGGGSTLNCSHKINAGENYMEVMFMFSSVLSTGTWLKNTSNAMSTDGSIILLPIELP
jgi:hypothetical protein